MIKRNKYSFVLALAITFTVFIGCNQASGYKYVEQVGSVEDFNVKAFPGANLLTWSPSEISNGYAIFRDGKYLKTVSNTETSYFDFISTTNEWKDGQELKYTIQNCGRDLSRSATEADIVIVGSTFSEVTIKAINPGFKSEVIYKVPSYWDEASGTTQVGSFEDFDYSNPDAILNLVEPFATLTEKDNFYSLFSFSQIPYLNTRITVSNEEETESIDFTFDLRAKDMELNLSELGNAEVFTPFIGLNKIWAEFSDPNGYYSSKKVLLTSKYTYSSDAYKFQYSEVRIDWDASRECYVATWPIPTNWETKEKVTDYSFYLYTYDAGWYNLKRIDLYPEMDEFNDCYKAYINVSYDLEFKPWRFFAVSNNGAMHVDYPNDVPVSYAEGLFFYPGAYFGNVNYSVYGTGMELYWNRIQVAGKEVSGNYEVWYSTSRDSVTGEWEDYSRLQVEVIDESKTAVFMSPIIDTNYVVKAYYKGELVGKSSVTYHHMDNSYTPEPEPIVPTPTSYNVYYNGMIVTAGYMDWFISEYVNRYNLIEDTDYYVYSDAIELTNSGYSKIYPDATFDLYYNGQTIVTGGFLSRFDELCYISDLRENEDYYWSGTDVFLYESGYQKLFVDETDTVVTFRYQDEVFFSIPYDMFDRFCEVVNLTDVDFSYLDLVETYTCDVFDTGYEKINSYMNNF